MFGVANQLLASVALAVGTTLLINMGRAKYAWVTFVPLCFVAITTLTAGYMSIRDNFWPLAIGGRSGAARAGLRQFDLHRDHDGLRGHHSAGDGAAQPARDQRTAAGAGARGGLTVDSSVSAAAATTAAPMNAY